MGILEVNFSIRCVGDFLALFFWMIFYAMSVRILWEGMPFVSESALGLLIGLMMEKCLLFLGAPGSIFSGFVHRGWDRLCWNRIQVRSALKNQLAWYRERPKCIGLPHFFERN
jgi:hypothetical protein